MTMSYLKHRFADLYAYLIDGQLMTMSYLKHRFALENQNQVDNFWMGSR